MNTRIHRKHLVVAGGLALAAATTTAAVSAASGPQPLAADPGPFDGTDPATASIPTYDYDDPSRSFVVEADFGMSGATVNDVSVGMGRSRSHLGDPSLLELRLRSATDAPLGSIDAWDPRWVFEETAGGGERMEVRPGPGMLITPFDADAESMVVYDVRAGQPLTTVDLAPAIREYCLDHPEDAQCVSADLAVTATGASGTGFSVVGATTQMEVATTVENLGPDGPVDAVVDEVVTAPAGVTVTPADSPWDADGLAVGAPREHVSSYDVTCEEPGVHTVTVESTIEPALAKVADPDASNDAGTAELEIECAIPVKLDVKPGSDRNPVNVKEATVPMAVLTTEAGEFGLPLSFDATTVEVDGLRIGNRAELVASGAGVPERHGKVHLEDVAPKDGDVDAMLHAAGRDIPVTASTTELCVRGTTTSGLSFFGCDVVDVVP